MARKLQWRHGKPSDRGTIYYIEAVHERRTFTLAKYTTGGVEKYGLWHNRDLVKIFDVRLEALNHAEGMV